MLHTTVTSSNLKEVWWQSETLYIQFNKGGVYAYKDVPLEKYNALVGAESIGSHFHSHIKAEHQCMPPGSFTLPDEMFQSVQD